MRIDWFTLVAQIVNFLILVALLKHFLYGRIVAAMRERQERIAASVEAAERERRLAEEEARAYRQRRGELEASRDELIEKARQEADETRQDLIRQARAEAQELRERWRQALDHEKDAFLRDFRQQVAEQVCRTAGRALKDLADAELEQQVIAAFLRRLREGDDGGASAVECLAQSPRGVLVRTSFDLPPEAREQITETLRGYSGEAGDFRFERADDLVCGIELLCEGRKISWSVADHLDALCEAVIESLDEGGATTE